MTFHILKEVILILVTSMMVTFASVSATAPTRHKEANDEIKYPTIESSEYYDYNYAQWLQNHPHQRRGDKRMPLYSNSESKLWMDYRAVTDTRSKQYHILRNSEIGSDGILRYNGYICVALGQRYGRVGDKFSIKIHNHEVKAIMADAKRWEDTQGGNGWNDPYGNVLEIIVHDGSINSRSKAMGDMNYTDTLHGPVREIWKLASVSRYKMRGDDSGLARSCLPDVKSSLGSH